MIQKIFKIFLVLALFASPAFAALGAKKEVKKGNLLYNEGEFEEALKQYEDAISLSPDSDIVNFNLGAALYKTGDYQKAIEHFQKALVSEDSSVEQKASYNIGNAEYKFGNSKEERDLPTAINLLKQALRHYGKALEIDPEDEDAKYNYEFVRKELKRLEQKAEQQTGQDQQKEDQKSQTEQKEESSKQERCETEQQQTEAEQQQQMREQEKASRQEEKEGEEGKQPLELHEENEKISKEEALMLLEGYRQEEEPEGLYKEKIPMGDMEKVLKDW